MHAHEDEKLWFGLLKPLYMYVWAALLVLTIIETIVPEPTIIGLPAMPRTVTVVTLILLALTKTVLVAGYYMHLVGEKPSLIPIACAPFLFSLFLTVGLFPYPGQA